MSKKFSQRSSPRTFFLITAAVGVAVTAFVLRKLGGGLLPAYPFWLLCSSIVTFFFYGYDKRQSRSGGWRVPEAVLHLLSLIGGFAGGYLGRRFFRHKTQEPLFLVVIVLAALLHAGFCTWRYLL
ncbi:MAG: DUF1294 domain-containing protein [Fretibacterium sp.]|nr:DUF1294 domain-containing protein [Fretibacterium sp.]